MKKLTIFVSALTLTTSLFAQDLTSKKGENYLPETGDWAIGIDANPFLDYIGNFIGGNGLNTSPNWDYVNSFNQTIIGKYFVSEKMAYRGSLRLGFGSTSTTNMVADRASGTVPVFPAMNPLKENVMKDGGMNINLGGGLEWRKGTTRLQGFYGGELGLMIGSSKQSYTYGNALNADINEPARVVVDGAADGFNGGANITTDTYGNAARHKEAKSSSFGFGLRGFVGVEYFVIPKLSVGGEFGWGLGVMSMKSSQEIESVGNNGTGDAVGTQATDGNKTSMFGFDTDINNTVFGQSGRLKITFHF